MESADALPSHSQSAKGVKNGHRQGKQSYLCRNCNRQFRENPQAGGYSAQVKDLCVKMSLNGMGWSGIERVISSPVAPDLYNGGVVKGRARSNHYGQTSGY